MRYCKLSKTRYNINVTDNKRGKIMARVIDIEIAKTCYDKFKRLENITGSECYQLGYKKGDTISLQLKVDNKHNLYVAQVIPNNDSDETYVTATLHNIIQDKYIDIVDGGGSILGEWSFNTDKETIIVNLLTR